MSFEEFESDAHAWITWPRVHENAQTLYPEVRPGDYVPGPGIVVDVDRARYRITFANGMVLPFTEDQWFSIYGYEGVRRRFIIEEEPV